jgi:hypothetical protein
VEGRDVLTADFSFLPYKGTNHLYPHVVSSMKTRLDKILHDTSFCSLFLFAFLVGVESPAFAPSRDISEKSSDNYEAIRTR